MRPLSTLSLAAAVAFALSTPAVAASPSRVCRLVTDPPGDQQELDRPAPASLDILSADIASGRHTVVAAVRIAEAPAGMLQTYGGVGYDMTFRSGDAVYVLSAAFGPDGWSYVYTRAWLPPSRDTDYGPADQSGGGVASGSFDAARRIVRIEMPRGELFSSSRGKRFTSIAVNSKRGTVVTGTADSASTRRSYLDGTPSCLNPA